MTDKTKKPKWLTAVAVLSVLSGIFFIAVAVRQMIARFEVLDVLTQVNPWYRSGIPAEIALNAILVVAGIIQLAVAYWLWFGQRRGIRLALLSAIMIVIANLLGVALILAAPSRLEISPFSYYVYLGIGIVLLIVYWRILFNPKNREYFGVSHIPMQVAPAKSVNLEHVVVRQGKFFCRYCGTENPADALFCESCGKKLR